MLRTQNTIMISRKLPDVYRFVAVEFFDNYQKWSPEVCELEKLTYGEMRVGVEGRQTRHDEGHRSEARFRVTHLVSLRELRFASLSKPRFDVRYLFEPAPCGARLIFRFQLQLPVLMLPLRRRIADSVERGSERVVRNIKTLLESGTVEPKVADIAPVVETGSAVHGPASG